MSQERDHRSVPTSKAAGVLAATIFALAAALWLILFAAPAAFDVGTER